MGLSPAASFAAFSDGAVGALHAGQRCSITQPPLKGLGTARSCSCCLALAG